MEIAQYSRTVNVLNTVRALLGFSRVLISFFVMVQAGLAAIIALKGLPSMEVMILGIIACLFGSSALIAFNDLMDLKIDKEKIKFRSKPQTFDMGSLFIQHPVAHGILSLKVAVIWVLLLTIISMAFTYAIKPWLAPILIMVAFLIAVYSLLSTVSVFKFLAVASAVVVGAVAGWLAVAPADTRVFPLFVLWTFLWELGGRNLPNDFGDMGEDAQVGIKTVPVVYGGVISSKIIFVLVVAVITTSAFMSIALSGSYIVMVCFILIGLYFLLRPALKLLKNPVSAQALYLFNQASIYPVVILLFLLLSIYILKIF